MADGASADAQMQKHLLLEQFMLEQLMQQNPEVSRHVLEGVAAQQMQQFEQQGTSAFERQPKAVAHVHTSAAALNSFDSESHMLMVVHDGSAVGALGCSRHEPDASSQAVGSMPAVGWRDRCRQAVLSSIVSSWTNVNVGCWQGKRAAR